MNGLVKLKKEELKAIEGGCWLDGVIGAVIAVGDAVSDAYDAFMEGMTDSAKECKC